MSEKSERFLPQKQGGEGEPALENSSFDFHAHTLAIIHISQLKMMMVVMVVVVMITVIWSWFGWW